jgi:dihydrofolate reductase
MTREVVLYIAQSLDGYIAQENDDLSFLSMVAQEGEDYGYADFYQSVDTIILGRKTYDWVMTQVEEFPHADKKTFVLTRQTKPSIGEVQFYNGDLKALVNSLKQEKGGTIFIDGGAEVVNALLKEHLIDRFIISVIPVLLGGGVRLFYDKYPMQDLALLTARSYPKGLVQLHYKRIGG